MIRIAGLVILLPAMILVVLAFLYTLLVVMAVVGIVNTYDYFIGDEDEKATAQKQSSRKR